jgi:hypothetical protein
MAVERTRVRRELPAAQVLELHGANHYVFDSNRAEVIRLMRTFLATNAWPASAAQGGSKVSP